MKTVLVSGCYDLLHAGHMAFLEQAASFGQLHVCVGADANVEELKGRPPLFSQEERVYLLNRLECVHEARVSGGWGMLDFAPDLDQLRPDVFVVNHDGHTPGKEALCREKGIEYLVLDRIPAENFPARSSTDSKARNALPYRVCLAGGWLDQPWVSELAAGPVIVAQLEPTIEFMDRAGMATSSRRAAEILWGRKLPDTRLEHQAKVLFSFENPPGTRYVSGSQDALGIMLPGINRLDYAGGYWPEKIDRCVDPEIAVWLQSVLHLVPVCDRPEGYDPLLEKNLDPVHARRLAASGHLAWESILKRDAVGLGQALNETLESWRKLLPLTVSDELMERRASLASGALGSCYSGCGGGYLMLISERPVEDAVPLRISLPSLHF